LENLILNNSDFSPEDCVRNILKASGTPDPLDDLVAHAKAVGFGSDVISVIEKQLLSSDWSNIRAPGKIGALTALMLVVHDIDEEKSREIMETLCSSERCHPAIVQRLRTITRFSLSNYEHFTTCGIEVLVQNCIGNRAGVKRLLRGWLANIPMGDLAGISRVFVIRPGKLDYWGQYLRVLSKIALVWRPWNPLGTEFTFYHEIGHHVHRTGKFDDQEPEALADRYAYRRFEAAHKIVGRGLIGTIVLTIFAGSYGREFDVVH